MTYTELEAALKSWLNRENFPLLEAEIPLFFELAQERIDRDPLFKLLEAQDIVTLSAFDATIPLDYSKAISMTLPAQGGAEITGAPIAQVQRLRSFDTLEQPILVAPMGTEFLFGPAPDQDYNISLVYQRRLVPVSPTTATNELSLRHPSLILFGALFEACLWLKDDARAGVWEKRYQQTMRALSVSDEYKRYEGGSLQVRAM